MLLLNFIYLFFVVENAIYYWKKVRTERWSLWVTCNGNKLRQHIYIWLGLIIGSVYTDGNCKLGGIKIGASNLKIFCLGPTWLALIFPTIISLWLLQFTIYTSCSKSLVVVNGSGRRSEPAKSDPIKIYL